MGFWSWLEFLEERGVHVVMCLQGSQMKWLILDILHLDSLDHLWSILVSRSGTPHPMVHQFFPMERQGSPGQPAACWSVAPSDCRRRRWRRAPSKLPVFRPRPLATWQMSFLRVSRNCVVYPLGVFVSSKRTIPYYGHLGKNHPNRLGNPAFEILAIWLSWPLEVEIPPKWKVILGWMVH